MTKISTCKNEKSRYSKDWYTQDVENEQELINIVKSEAYSNAYFKNNRRSQDNILGYHQFLILDIDNDEAHFTIEDCKTLFIEKGIKSLIVPSKSHLKSKNGVIKERYRVFCYLDQVIPAYISKEQYKEMMKLIAEDLGMTEHVDTKALYDRARLYYPTHNLEEILIEKTPGAKIELQKYLDQSETVLNSVKPKKERKVNTKKETKVEVQTIDTYVPSNITYTINRDIWSYNISEMSKEIDFEELIYDTEGVFSSEKESKGTKLRTDIGSAYFLFTETMILHDFKEEMNYNLVSYIKKMKSCNHIEVLDTLKNYVDISSYRTVSDNWGQAMSSALKIAKNAKELKEILISLMNFNAINIHRDKEDIIYIAGKRYHISDFMLADYKNKQDLINQFQKNRKK